MLLTGFDAPIEGVMYLARPIREAELLQAIARVNRTGYGKTAGIVVDYYGIGQNLKEALRLYRRGHRGALQSSGRRDPQAPDRHARVIAMFRDRGVDALHDTEAAVEALVDERLRAEFSVKLKQFLATLDLVLPRPEGFPSFATPRTRGDLHASAEPLPKAPAQLDKGVGRKVQALIDEHIISARHRPPHPAHRHHRREVRRPSREAGLGPREGVRDGARDPAPHQDEARGRPSPLPEALRAAGRDPSQVRRELGAARHRTPGVRRAGEERAQAGGRGPRPRPSNPRAVLRHPEGRAWQDRTGQHEGPQWLAERTSNWSTASSATT